MRFLLAFSLAREALAGSFLFLSMVAGVAICCWRWVFLTRLCRGRNMKKKEGRDLGRFVNQHQTKLPTPTDSCSHIGLKSDTSD